MPGEITVNIKRQPFDPPFVLRIGDEDVSARIGRINDKSAVVKIKGLGTYKIDITGVGFWFVERNAILYEPISVMPEIHGGILERMGTVAAKFSGQYCGAVAKVSRGIRNILIGREC